MNTASVYAQFDASHIRAVDASAAACGDGTMWNTAYRYLQDALAFASNPQNGIDEIWVAAGTYYTDQDCANPDGSCSPLPCDQSASFELINGVKLYGGFDGTEIFLVDRDPENNITILTGDIDQDGDAHDIDNSWHVVTADGVGGATLINGFTISDGYADGGGMDNNGAGILNLDASLFIVRCTLTKNDAFNGGGMYVDVTGTAAPTVFNCTFLKNNANEGIGMRLEGDPELILVVNCLFAWGSGFGGAIYATGPDADFINCTFYNNDYGFCPGAHIQSYNGSQITITNSIITQPSHGPHFRVETGSSITVSYSNAVGGVFLHPETCPVPGVTDGGGNIDADPMFCDPMGPNFNFRLQDGSLCIDTGSDAAVPVDSADVDDDGNTTEKVPWDLDTRIRQFNADANVTEVDMGAYENQHDQLCPADLDYDCQVGVRDLLILLAAWGPNPAHPADLDCSSDVGLSDLLSLLADWGPCPCDPEAEPPSLQEELEDACLSQEDWDDFVDVMQNGTEEEKENYLCWMIHYLDHCPKCTCTHIPMCPGPDPFS